MNVQNVTIKSISTNNLQKSLKELYVVIQVGQDKWVERVREIGFGETMPLQQFSTPYILCQKESHPEISIWDYDSVKQIKKLTIPTQVERNSYTFKFDSPNIQIQFRFSPVSTNPEYLQFPQQSHKTPRFSLPSLKKRLSKRNSLKLQSQNSNQTSAALYPSAEPSQISFSYPEKNSQNQTSLQKIIKNHQQTTNYHFKEQTSKNQVNLIKLPQNKKSFQGGSSINLFDDYEARPKQLTKKYNIESENTKQSISNQKIVSALNTTTSSSTVKKNLKSVISILTENPQKIGPTQRSSLGLELQANNMRQFFYYGLAQSKKMQENIKMKNEMKNDQPRSKQEKLRLVDESDLTKKSIQKLAKMTSFELSKSIFQQYGLDLSLTKVNSSRSFEKSKFLKREKSQVKQIKKTKNSVEMRKRAKKFKQKVKNQQDNNGDNKFEDYGECLLLRKAQSSMSLRRMERPK